MENTQKTTCKEAKIIYLPKTCLRTPQIPEETIMQGVLQLQTLEYIDQILDEHLK